MCTVSYIPVGLNPDPGNTSGSICNEQYVLTSNRDERKMRLTVSPVTEVIGDTAVYFPKDLEAGGTWIAAGDNGKMCCLLNGAFERHERKPLYAKSRGQLLLETFKYENIYDFFDLCELDDMEPFTLIVVEMEEVPKLIEFIWDGNELYIRELEHDRPYIWSSATLYGKKVRMRREQLFNKWLKKESKFDRESILKFHSSTHGNDRANDIIMKRDHGLETVSITQVAIGSDSFSMYYYDLLLNQMVSLTKGIKKMAIH